MKKCTDNSIIANMARLSAMLLLLCAFGAHATAPRIAAQMFGEEKKADIVVYQPATADARLENELTLAIVAEAFKASGKTPIIDVLPSRQIASYALFNNEAVAMIGSTQDLAGKEKQYSVVTFYLRNTESEPLQLIFSNAHGKALHKAFSAGMQIILKNGKYQELLEKSRGKLPSDYLNRLKSLNPGWK